MNKQALLYQEGFNSGRLIDVAAGTGRMIFDKNYAEGDDGFIGLYQYFHIGRYRIKTSHECVFEGVEGLLTVIAGITVIFGDNDASIFTHHSSLNGRYWEVVLEINKGVDESNDTKEACLVAEIIGANIGMKMGRERAITMIRALFRLLRARAAKAKKRMAATTAKKTT